MMSPFHIISSSPYYSFIGRYYYCSHFTDEGTDAEGATSLALSPELETGRLGTCLGSLPTESVVMMGHLPPYCYQRRKSSPSFASKPLISQMFECLF